MMLTFSLSYKYYLVIISDPISPKLCCKHFENRSTSKKLTIKNDLDLGILHTEIDSKGSYYFPEKNKSENFIKNTFNQHLLVRKTL